MNAPQPINRRQALPALAALFSPHLFAMNTATPPVMGLPAEVAPIVPQARLLGQGALRFFGLLVYEARLWGLDNFVADTYERQPFALELQYARKLDGPAIAERSIAEMRRVGPFDEAQGKAWLALMMQAFPTVRAQDRLTGVHNGQGQVRFFHNGRLTASTDDRDYARLFFGIWLSPKTSAPALRAALTGQSKA